MATPATYRTWKSQAKQYRVALRVAEETGSYTPEWEARIRMRLDKLNQKIAEYETANQTAE